MSTFMQRQVTAETRWLKIETEHGTEFVSVFDCGLDWPNSSTLSEDRLCDAITQLQNYTDGQPQSWENIKGFGARLSAPGYMDRTEWAVFSTEQEANDYLEEMYPEDEDYKVEECPQCHNLCNDDVTIADHGVCYDCHKENLNTPDEGLE